MRGLHWLGFALTALALFAHAHAHAHADEGKPIRSARLFLMSAPGEQKPADQGGIVPELHSASGFRLIDLTRDKVGEAMRDSFSSIAPGSELADREYEQVPLSPYSDIAVPGWMRAPTLSAPPAPDVFVPDCMAVPYRPSGFLPLHIETRRRSAYNAMSAAACEAGIPVGLFDALILAESAYNPDAVSPKRAYGLAQLMPGTAAGLGVDRFDPLQNLEGGARYLRAQLDNFGQVHLALAAYNAGPGRVKGGRVPPIAETQSYVREVLDKWTRLTSQHRTAASTRFPASAPDQPARVERVRGAAIQVF